MARILLAGIGPLPSEGDKQLFAPGLRVWIFAQTLCQAGHQVRLALGQFGQQSGLHLYDVSSQDGKSTANPLSNRSGDLASLLRPAAIDFGAQALVASTDVMANAAVAAAVPVPLWVDFYGSPMAERQQQACLFGHDGGVAAAWRMIVPALLGADHFSACSGSQRLALIGELGACGRLNHLTAGHNLVAVIPPGVAFQDVPPARGIIRGRIVPQDAFVVLWSGGFNTWTDVETLHEGLVMAMETEPSIHFVSTGGAIPGHCEEVYPRFQQLVAQGLHRERFHLLGWVDLSDVFSAWQEADLAVNIDRFSYEGLLGTRTRLLDWMNVRLPVATTALSDLNCMLAERDLVLDFKMGEAQSLKETLLKALHEPDELHSMTERALHFLRTHWTNAQLLEPLLKWAQAPSFAPDLQSADGAQKPASPSNALAVAANSVLRETSSREQMERFEDENYRLRQQLDRLQGSRLIRAIMRARNIAPIPPKEP